MPAIYSRRFGAIALTAASQDLGTVPSGKIWILKDLTLGWGTLARVGGRADVLLSATNSRIWVVNLAASEVKSDHWTGYMVLPAGERIRGITTATGTIYLTASGYEFDVV